MPRLSSLATPDHFSWPQVYVGVTLTAMATLLLELSLTRIFSVVFYYHFAFLAISIALFGLGAGGVFSYVVASWPGNLFTKLGTLAATNSVVVLLSLVFLLTRPGEFSGWTLALVYFASALPFFLAGTVVSLVISETIERVDRVYFYDLIGAAGGCILLVPLLNTFGGPSTVIAVGALFAASSAVWFNEARLPSGRVGGVLVSLLLVLLLSYNAKWHSIDVRYAKGQRLSSERFVQWNSISRIAVTPEPGSNRFQIVIDGDAASGIANLNFDHLSEADRSALLRQGPGFAYWMRPGAKTLIIGPGGGWDVTRALASGSRDVTGVEINPIIANTVMRRRFPGLSNHLYSRPEVHIEVEDGRSFVRRSQDKYQVVQATLVDTWASTAAGALALSENNLYTSDAFVDYLRHLTDDGLLAFTRWGFDPPRESLRLLSLARVALKRLGEQRPERHVMVLRDRTSPEQAGGGARDTVLISRKPFSAADIERARHAAQATDLTVVYLPGDPDTSAFARLLLAHDPLSFEQDYRYDVSPVDDNRPFFFFYTVQPRDLWDFVTRGAQPPLDYRVNRAVPMLFALVGVSITATAIVLLLPPLLLGSRLPRERGLRTQLWYFVCIGVGYILIQVALLQRFVLLLGHPTYALTVILFAMLVSSGAGSYFSRRVVSDSRERLRLVLMAVAGSVAVLAFLVPWVTQASAVLPLPFRVLITAVLIAPVGFVMGMPFPMGLARLEQQHSSAVRWAWSLNAAASVMGSAFAIFLALYVGLRETLLIGGVLYLLALVSLVRRPGVPESSPASITVTA